MVGGAHPTGLRDCYNDGLAGRNADLVRSPRKVDGPTPGDRDKASVRPSNPQGVPRR